MTDPQRLSLALGIGALQLLDSDTRVCDQFPSDPDEARRHDDSRVYGKHDPYCRLSDRDPIGADQHDGKFCVECSKETLKLAANIVLNDEGGKEESTAHALKPAAEIPVTPLLRTFELPLRTSGVLARQALPAKPLVQSIHAPAQEAPGMHAAKLKNSSPTNVPPMAPLPLRIVALARPEARLPPPTSDPRQGTLGISSYITTQRAMAMPAPRKQRGRSGANWPYKRAQQARQQAFRLNAVGRNGGNPDCGRPYTASWESLNSEQRLQQARQNPIPADVPIFRWASAVLDLIKEENKKKGILKRPQAENSR